MKRLILFMLLSFCLVFSASALPMMVTSGVREDVSCTKGSAVMALPSGTHTVALSSDAEGQSISDGSEWSLYSIEVAFHGDSSSCVAEVRIGTAKDLSSYIEAWTGIAPDDAGETIELVSVDNDTFSASTTYYIGLVETSGTCVTLRNNTNPYAGGVITSTGTAWTLGADDSASDEKIAVFRCN